MVSWTPQPNLGTWHRYDYGTGAIAYEQCVKGIPTGLFFVVSRWKYRWIWTLVKVHRWPLVGWLARRLLARIQVKYHWIWLSNGKRIEA
jgi:hypothetical protein